MAPVSSFSGVAGLVLALTATVGGPTHTYVPASRMQPYKVTGAGLRRRQLTSWPKGRAAKGRCAGSAGKLRP